MDKIGYLRKHGITEVMKMFRETDFNCISNFIDHELGNIPTEIPNPEFETVKHRKSFIKKKEKIHQKDIKLLKQIKENKINTNRPTIVSKNTFLRDISD